MMKRGSLIVFEGLDRSGKTTQCKRVCDFLKSQDKGCHFMRFPDRTTIIGGLIGKYLECSTDIDDHAIHLLFSANRWEMITEMKKMLLEGKTLIVDRYAFSGTAFSATKPGMNIKWCQQSDAGLLKPDLVVYLDIDPKLAQTRGDYGAERYENLLVQNQVRKCYLQMKDETWRIVDASKTEDEVFLEVCNIIKETVDREHSDAPLQQLWI